MKRVLALDGGGMLGLISCCVLEKIEADQGRPVCELFDLIAGTSIGGIMAGLLAIGVPASQIKDFFTVSGPKIFDPTFFGKDGILEPRYPAEPIEEVLRYNFGGLLMKDAKTKLLITAFNLNTGAPAIFKSYDAEDAETPLWMPARASSAAQTYFPAFVAPCGNTFWDGGNIANSPGMCALADAVNLWGWSEPIKLLSLGCGQRPWTVNAAEMVNAGIVKAAATMCSSLIGAEQQEVDFQLRAMLGADYTRINPVLDSDLPIDGARPEQILELQKWGAVNVAGAIEPLNQFFSPSSPPS